MRRLGIWVLHVVVLAIAVEMTFAPTFSGRLQTDPGDTLLNHYILEHSWKCLTDPAYPGSFWSPPCFYPQPGTLAYSENMLGVAPLYWAARCIADPLPAYQFWMIAVFALTYAATAWVLHRFNVTPLLSACGAAAYTFGLPRINQLGHQQLLAAMYLPLAIYWCWQFLEQPRIGRLVWTVAFVLLQLLASIYLGWFLALALATIVFIRLFDSAFRVRSMAFFREHLYAAIAIAGIASAFLFALLLPYVQANQGFKRSYRHEIRLMLPRLDSLISPPPASLWARVLPPTDGPLNHEHHLFPGIVLYGLCGMVGVVALIRRKQIPRHAVVFLLAGGVLMFISLTMGKISVWPAVYAIVPGAKAIRAVTRIVAVVHLLWWIGSLCAVSQWLRMWPRLAAASGVVLLTMGLGEQFQPNLPAFDAKPFFAEVARLREEMRGGAAVYVEPDEGSPFWVSHLAAMWAGLEADVPVVNGYSGRTPRGYPDEKKIWDADDLANWLGGRSIRVISSLRLAAAYPAPPSPPGEPGLDFRPYRSQARAERE